MRQLTMTPEHAQKIKFELNIFARAFTYARARTHARACTDSVFSLGGEISLERKKKSESGNLSEDFTLLLDIFGEDFLPVALFDKTSKVVCRSVG